MKKLREKLISKRNATPYKQRISAANNSRRILQSSAKLLRYQHYGCYFSVAGEFPTESIVELLQQYNKTVYMPVIGSHSSMKFRRFDKQDVCRRNRYDIPEPHNSEPLVEAITLDVVIVPLVGFDNQGNRIGMGGGFYDRALEAVKKTIRPDKPILVGLAFECQRVIALKAEKWDVPLNAVLTESTLDYF